MLLPLPINCQISWKSTITFSIPFPVFLLSSRETNIQTY